VLLIEIYPGIKKTPIPGADAQDQECFSVGKKLANRSFKDSNKHMGPIPAAAIELK
jgi:hypothetical protein